MDSKTGLSVTIVAGNAEDTIADCLKSVSFADEIVVVIDSRCEDNTKAIAESFGCRVYTEEWKGYDGQKNSAVQKCTNEWVLSIDSDETVPDTTRDAILKELLSPRCDVYRLPRKNHLHGRWLKRGDFWPDWQIRLFKKSSGRFVGNPHDKWVSNAPVGTIDEPIEHYSFKDYEDMIRRMNTYSNIGALELYKKGIKANRLTPLVHGLSMFIKIYLIKRGFLDGFDGLVNAVLKASGSFFKYAKLIELRNQKTD
ncbi:MAG: glycosyltransferase family 2 protein [Thermodesulfovibrionales bacterium]